MLTEQQLDHVSGGASSNLFIALDGTTVTKQTGSFNAMDGTGKNGGTFFGDQGASNSKVHFANK
jgi:hypothetical protein